jgi:asparagine synthase (glutamine-hydrolysing)
MTNHICARSIRSLRAASRVKNSMSIQFGLWQRFGPAVGEREVLELGALSARHATEGTSVACRRNIGMGLQTFTTHQRSQLESRPVLFADGLMVSLDGRIDNYAELSEEINLASREIADSFLVAALYRKQGSACFSKLIGDWAIAIWSPSNDTLYLARDHAGTRTLYFEISEERVLWSTVLDTFVGKGRSVEFDEAYAGRYLSGLPIRDLTPYKGIHSVTPSHFLAVSLAGIARQRHWEPTVRERIRYRSDSEYEQHFLTLFCQSVRRRTGPGAPIVAELSGGMDSSSIVCVSDRMRLEGGASPAELLDTVSRFDDSEPNWDERRYFSIVEAQRRKAGIHLNIAFENRTFEPLDPEDYPLPVLPGIDRYAAVRQKQLAAAIAQGGYRSILSGIGGDEVLGGVPSPYSELADYLVAFDLRRMVSRAFAFSLVDRTPVLHMLVRTVASSSTTYWTFLPAKVQVPPWIPRELRRRASDAQIDANVRVPRFGLLPSSIENGMSWWKTLESMPHLYPSVAPRSEYRYPYLDRDLVDFLFRIPREQLVRPGRRRSLMRRALQGIVPADILERPRKGSLIRGPLVSLQRSEPDIRAIFTKSLIGAMGLVDENQLKTTLSEIVKGTSPRWWPAVINAIQMEFWLRVQSEGFEEASTRGSIQRSLHLDRGADEIRASNAAS